MKIGYACLISHTDEFKYKTIKLSTITNELLKEVIRNNIDTLDRMLDYNIENNIKMFRITSDLIPFGISKHNKLNWWEIFSNEFSDIKKKIVKNDIRISMHPGQYTVINTPHENVLENSINDLEYHALVLDLLDSKNIAKIILHVGGVYGDKETAIERFIKNFNSLNPKIKKRLVIENDDKSYTVEDVLYISSRTKIPVVFDNLHNRLNGSNKDEFELLEKCMKTWDGIPKMHYSDQDDNKKNGGHSKRINTKKFIEFIDGIKDKNLDIMLEVKDKNVSAIKCNVLINHNQRNYIEQEWSRYKYSVMEKSYKEYLNIKEMLKNNVTAYDFYLSIDAALEKEKDDEENTLLHVWGYFKKTASEKEKEKFFKLLKSNKASAKKYLHKLAKDYNQKYLLDSYYFM